MFLSVIEIEINSLFDEVAYGHESNVKEMLDTGIPVDICDNEGTTPLMTAAGNKQISVIELLLQRGADVNKQNNSGRTALHCASFLNLTDTIRVLVGKGASTKIKNEDGHTALDVARLKKHEEAILLLEQH